MKENSLLDCDQITFAYREHTVLDGVGFSMDEGDLVGVIGPNGSGKSTLIKVLSGILKPQRGTVRLEGKDLSRLSRRSVAKQLAFVAQEEQTEFGFGVAEEVMLGRFPHHGGLHFEDETDWAVAQRVMEQTRVEDLAHRSMDELSGGERQRVRIARALAQEPRVLMLDEPTNHLDLYSQLSLMQLLREINGSGLTILLVSHDINFISQTCSRVQILHDKKIRFSGAPREVITEANIAESFRIRARVDPGPEDGFPRMTPMELLSDPSTSSKLSQS